MKQFLQVIAEWPRYSWTYERKLFITGMITLVLTAIVVAAAVASKHVVGREEPQTPRPPGPR